MRPVYHLGAMLLWAALSLLTACGDAGKFTVEASFDNVSSPTLRVVFMSDSGLTDATVPRDERGTIRIAGHSSQPTLLFITGDRNTVLARAIVTGGDKLKVHGDARIPDDLLITGNQASERWLKFRTVHDELYDNAPCTALDDSIIAYATAHRDDITSAVLLLCDHSSALTDQKALAAFAALEPAARPAGITASAATLAALVTEAPDRVDELRLISNDGKRLTTVSLTGKPTVTLCWSPIDSVYKAHHNFLDNLSRQGQAAIIDIDVDGDSAKWQRSLKGIAGKPWTHLWAPAGPLEPGIETLAVGRTPLYVVNDSAGTVLYRGSDTTAVRRALSKTDGAR